MKEVPRNRYVLVTFKPDRKEERFYSFSEIAERCKVLDSYAVKYQAFEEKAKVVRERITFNDHK